MNNGIGLELLQERREKDIVATRVTDEQERLLCLPRVAGARCVVLEHTVYAMLRAICDTYDGGFWDYYKLSNGGFYMAPASESLFHLVCENYFERDVSADAAGVIATSYAYSHLSFSIGGERFGLASRQLSSYIAQREDAVLIFAALD